MKVSTFLILFSTGALFATGCRTTVTDRPQLCTVTSLRGTARWWGANSNEVHDLKVGDRIAEGSTIQIPSGIDNYVDLATGRRTLLPELGSEATYDPKDQIRIFENTALKLVKVSLKTEGRDRIPDTRLELFQGSILFHERMERPVWRSKAAAPSRAAVKPYHEIRTGNIVIRAEKGIFFFSASGIVRVVSGMVALECIDQGTTINLSSGQQYDSLTGTVKEMDKDVRINLLGGCFFSTPKPPPDYGVPLRRPF